MSGVVITRDDIIAYAEVDYIIHHMNEKYVEKIPAKLLQFFATIKDPEHEVYVNPRVPLQNQNLNFQTKIGQNLAEIRPKFDQTFT